VTTHRTLACIFAALLALDFLIPTEIQSARRVSIIDLGVLPGTTSSEAYDINNKGQIVGNAFTGEPFSDGRAFIWNRGVLTDLGTLGGTWARASKLNERGQVIGQSETAQGFEHGFVWENGVLRDLGTLGAEFTSSHASAINNRGQIVGETQTGLGGRAFLWQDGVMRDISSPGLPPEEPFDQGSDINERGQVALASGAVWFRGDHTPLEGIGGRVSAFEINNRGQVAGRVFEPGPDGESHEATWKQGSALTDLHVPGQGGSVELNEKGLVAVTGTTADGTRVFTWKAGRLRDLGPLPGGINVELRDLNNRGEIIADGGDYPEASLGFLSRGGRLIDLRTLLPDGSSVTSLAPQGINDPGADCGMVRAKRHKARLSSEPIGMRRKRLTPEKAALGARASIACFLLVIQRGTGAAALRPAVEAQKLQQGGAAGQTPAPEEQGVVDGLPGVAGLGSFRDGPRVDGGPIAHAVVVGVGPFGIRPSARRGRAPRLRTPRCLARRRAREDPRARPR